MKAFLIAFLKDEEGASAIEYALMAVMVVVAISAIVPSISTQIKIIFEGILTALKSQPATP